ncbi:MAG TPA: hypothetical protein VF587_09090 [Solirubrobacteraceae bacterium]|jgi:hypothetical protein
MQEILDGLWRWTAKHPAWKPAAEPGDADDWPQDVGCVAYRAERALVIVDPLVPEEGFLDELVEQVDLPVCVLQTIGWHSRSCEQVERRYADRLAEEPGPGVDPVPIGGAGETMVWLPAIRALVPGDRLIGDGEGGLRMCPDSWMKNLKLRQAGLAEALRPLLDLPVDAVIVSHGEAVLSDGRRLIARAIGEPDQ